MRLDFHQTARFWQSQWIATLSSDESMAANRLPVHRAYAPPLPSDLTLPCLADVVESLMVPNVSVMEIVHPAT